LSRKEVCVANIDYSSAPEAERPPILIFVALGLVLAATAYVISSARHAGLPEIVFLAGLALGGLGLLLTRALAAPVGKPRALGRASGFALLEGTREALALTGREGELLYANRAYRARFGARPPAQALSIGERESAEIFRLLRAALGVGRAEGLFTDSGPLPFPVALEQITERDGGVGLLVWRIGPSDKPQGPLLLEGKTAPPAAVTVDAAAPALADGGRVLPVAARIVDEAPVGIVLLDATGRIAEANRTFGRIVGRPSAEGLSLAALAAESDRGEIETQLAALAKAAPAGAAATLELRFSSADEGTERIAQIYLTRLDGGAERPLILGYLVDTTDQKHLELQFAQSQKMQAVGQLAGGIAHDFNNTLQAIIGFCELLLNLHPPGDPSFADIDQIRQNATRAAGLVRQLLAFSRQQTLMPTVIWLPDAIAENRMLLKRLVGEKVNLEIKHDRDLGLVRVDETQLIQVLMNLAVNARDAMPDGGELSIRTANVSRAEAIALGHEIMRPDDYVLIEVADTGCGIPKELLGKIFEPFFTTKAVGQGTGLGLSTVYGIVKQTNGFVFPESELGKGTVFRIYLPRHFEAQRSTEADDSAAERPQDHTGRGTILLVEDEDAVRQFAARALGTRGYSVLEAAGGEIALEILHAHEGKIDMLISDVIMPGLDGPSLVKAVRAERPDMKIILISGYAEDSFRKELSREGQNLAFLPKPFALKQLISKVKEVMAG
jgi:PAS domain S-box-containing protein